MTELTLAVKRSLVKVPRAGAKTVGGFAATLQFIAEQSAPHRDPLPPKRRPQVRAMRVRCAMEPNAAITSIRHLYDAGAQSEAISLAFRMAERSRLRAMPEQISSVASLADAWRCGQIFADEERAFVLGYQLPHLVEPPEEVRGEFNLSQKFRNGQSARRQFRGARPILAEDV